MKYVIKDAKGVEIQWVNDVTITELPESAVELTDEEWDNRKGAASTLTAKEIAALEAEKKARETAKQAILDKLGITEDEAKVLLG